MPLTGIRIVEFAGIGPAPYAGQLLADMGADVVVVDRPNRGAIALEKAVDRRGKRSIILDLKSGADLEIALKLAEKSDVLIEGNRPGVMERLGLGPIDCHARNPALVYGRMTGWGQTGPLAKVAGHDINYISLTGALQAMGTADQPPPPPLNLVGDFGGGSLFLVSGILAAVIKAQRIGKGCVVDAAIVDGVVSMMGMVHGLDAAGGWTEARQSNWLDGARPYYRCYETADGRYMAVGSIEPKFFAILLEKLAIDPGDFGPQDQIDLYQRQADILSARFIQRTMTDWTALFDESDACVTPVLTYKEAAAHPHLAARAVLQPVGGMLHPVAAPRFGLDNPVVTAEMPQDGADRDDILRDLGISGADITKE